jgi:hypothetical protein
MQWPDQIGPKKDRVMPLANEFSAATGHSMIGLV